MGALSGTQITVKIISSRGSELLEKPIEPIEINYSTEYTPTLEKFHNSDAFLRGVMGPFGSGKTTGCIWEIMLKAWAQRPMKDGVRRSRWALVRKTYPMLEDTTMKTTFDWFPHQQFGKFNQAKHNYTINRMRHPGDGGPMEIEFMFRALEYEKHVENLLSLDLTGALINEARDFPIGIVNGLMGRVGRYPAIRDGGPTWWGVIADTNPPDDESWWYRMFEEMDFSQINPKLLEKLGNRSAFCELFRQPSGLAEDAENIPHLVPGYYETLEAVNPPDWVKVYVKGEYGFVQDGRPVYPEYRDELHCTEFSPIPGVVIKRGWDFGLSPACEFSQVTPEGRLVYFDELVATNYSLPAFAADVKLHCASNYPDFQFEDVGDPAGDSRDPLDKDLQTAYDMLRVVGIVVKAGQQGLRMRLDSVRTGLNRLINGRPQIQVTKKCRMLRKGFLGRYRYRKRAVGENQYQPQPEKDDYSHPHDAAQYIAADVLGKGLTRTPILNLPTSYDTGHKL